MPNPFRTSYVLISVALWLFGAILAGAAGSTQRLRPPAPQVLIFGVAALLIAAGLLVARLRAWLLSVDIRLFVALHLTRFVGVYFLWLYTRGELPYAFAVPGGWGDILVATTAAGLIATARPETRRGWLAYTFWNLFGLVDILFVVLTAARLQLSEPGSMAALLRLPLSLLPTWLVPLIIATHVLMLYRLWVQRPAREPAA